LYSKPFGLAWAKYRVAPAIESHGLRKWDILVGFDGLDVSLVGFRHVDVERLVAHGHELAAAEYVPVVIRNATPRSFVDDSLAALE
jgi:hypothetical protein